MRRRIATLLLPLAALSACATAGGGGSAPRFGGVGGPSAGEIRPMRVRLLEDGRGLTVELNRPAHTAVFEIFPGQGVALVSPDFGERSSLAAGSTRLFPSQTTQRIWAYDNVRANPYALASVMSQPRHLLVIASERPLRTERFERSPGLLRRAMGTTSYTALSSRRVVDDLLATVVPMQPDDSWDADVITLWPQATGTGLPAGDLYQVRCSSGGTVWVPLELGTAACRNPDRVLGRPVPPARRDSVGSKPGGPDSAGVRKPGGRRPLPEAEAGSEPRELRLSRIREELRSYRRGGADETAAEHDLGLTELRRDLVLRRRLSGDESEGVLSRSTFARGEGVSTELERRPRPESASQPTREPRGAEAQSTQAPPPVVTAPERTRPEPRPAPESRPIETSRAATRDPR